METFSEGIILHHVKKRYFSEIIYSFVGNILIALNPYRRIGDLYGAEKMEAILNLTKVNETVPPHVYSIAALALTGMRTDGKDQSVLISGVQQPLTMLNMLTKIVRPCEIQVRVERAKQKQQKEFWNFCPPCREVQPVALALV